MQLRFNILSVAFCLGLPSLAFGQFLELGDKVPAGTNTVVAMDVAALQATPLAKKEGWTQKLAQAYASRAVFLPPEADKLLLASQLSANQDFEEDWEVAVLTLTEQLSMDAIARAEGGYVDEIGGKQVVWSPSDAYLVPMAEKTLGIVSPAHRQEVSRWIEHAAHPHPDNLTPYLQRALSKVTPETQIVMAIDLKDAASPHRVEDRLKGSEVLKKSSLSLDQVVALVLSIQGATIEVSVGETARAKSRIDFAKPVNMADGVAKRLVHEALNRLGIQMTDMDNHQCSVVGKSIIMEGDLSSGGLRRLFSLLEVPTTKFSELKEESAGEKAPSAGDMAENSQVYFKSVTSLLDDLRGDRSKQDTRGGQDGVWMERYARKIDRLPILHVDDDLLEFGSKSAETLRIMAGARRGAGLSAGSQKAALRTSSDAGGGAYGAYGGGYRNYSYGYGGAGYGYGGVSGATSNEKDRNQITRQEQNKATGTKNEGWRLIEDATAAIRREMTKQYGVEF